MKRWLESLRRNSSRLRPQWSIRYKFVLSLALFTVVLSMSFGAISVMRLQSELTSQVQSNGEYIAQDQLTKFWGPGSDSTFKAFLQQAFSQSYTFGAIGPDILYVQIVKDGQSVTPVGSDEYAHALGLNGALKPPVRGYTATKHLPSGTPYIDLVRIPSQPPSAVQANYVRIGVSLSDVQSRVHQAFLLASGLTAIYIAIGLLLAFWLYKSILGPIDTLTTSVKHFRHDLKARAYVKSHDELETLSHEFNRMADSIQDRDSHLERVNAQLVKANRVKSEFLAIMGHELKTPLHAIRGYAQLLLEGIDGPVTCDQQKDLENIVKSGDHLNALMDNILQFSKLESGQERVHLSRLKVSRLLEDALQNVEVMAREKGIALQADANGLVVSADETKLRQVLINLLMNALKYTPSGEIEISAAMVQGDVQFRITDTGVGIPAAQQERIFEPFTQIDSSSTRQWGGIGLGLSIVKRYVEMHGGRIWVDSDGTHGSTFTFTIPNQQPTPGGSSEDPDC